MIQNMRIAMLDGQRRLLVNNHIVITRQQAEEQISKLTNLIETELPAARARLNAKTLLQEAQERIDKMIERYIQVKQDLEQVINQID